MKKTLILSLIFILFTATIVNATVPTPTLKYKHAGTFELWTEEAYYSSPAVVDLDKDGKKEIVFSNYTITVLDAKTGETKWKVNSGYDRRTPVTGSSLSNGHTWSDVEICDINKDGKPEIITAHGKGLISVLSYDGYFLPGWPKTPVEASARCVEVADLDKDGYYEIIVGYGVDSNESVYVFNYDGSLRKGWPQTNKENEKINWTYGLFMDTIAVYDIDRDGKKEIIVPSDLSQISIFRENGDLYMTNESVFGKRSWGTISLYEDYSNEIKSENMGWGLPYQGTEKREELYKGEFGHAKARVCDVDNNGIPEIVVTTIMCNRKYAPVYPPTEYMTVAILNADRTRFKNVSKGYNWEVFPMDLGEPLYQNPKTVASGVFHCPTIADIDGDGTTEILFNSYNGKVHCFNLKKSEPYAWPFSLTKRTSPMYEYASPVVCKDLDKDGKQEIIFASLYDRYQNYGPVNGNLYILNYEGRLLSKTPIPESKEGNKLDNGSRATPVVEDIDNDGKYEIVLNTLHGAICVYDL